MDVLKLELLLAMPAALVLALAAARCAVAAGFPVTPLDDRLGHVDGLRGFLALAVVLSHGVIWTYLLTAHRPWAATGTPFFDNLGTGAVSMFFMITGAVFYPRVAAGFDKVKWPQLYVSRVFRILPLSIVVTTVVAVGSAFAGGGAGGATPLETLRALADWVSGHGEPPLFGYSDSFQLNAGVMWSLWYEWIFYLAILPAMSVLAALLRGRSPPAAAPIALLAGALAMHLVKPASARVCYLMMFAAGMLIAEARRMDVVRARLAGPRVAAGLLALALACMITIPQTGSLVLLAAFALLLLAVASGNSLFGLLASRPARALGDASFSIYMLHGLVLWALLPLVPRTGLALSLSLPLAAMAAAGVALASYVYLERPMIERGKRVAGWRPRADRSLSVEVAP